MTSSVRSCLFFIALSGVTCTLQAQDSLQGRLRECAALTDDAQRLACFDRTAAGLASEKVREAAPPPAARPEPLPDTITAKVTTVRELSSGELVIELDNGQSWRTRPEDSNLRLKVGDAVTISRGAFGSFRLATPGKRFARVNRVR
jgi:hypothetical protein